MDVVFIKGEFFVKTFIPVTYYGRNRWNSIFSQLSWWISFQLMLKEYKGVTKQSEDQNIKYNSIVRINTTFSWFVDLPHDFLTHSRPPACKNLVLDLYCYRHCGIIILIQFKATENNGVHPLELKIFYLSQKFDLQVFSILTDGLWF